MVRVFDGGRGVGCGVGSVGLLWGRNGWKGWGGVGG